MFKCKECGVSSWEFVLDTGKKEEDGTTICLIQCKNCKRVLAVDSDYEKWEGEL